MIRIQGVCKRFGGHRVLRGVDAAFERGRVTAVVGPNGAGKSTLLRIVLGLTRPDAGSVLVSGEPIRDDGAYRRRIGYMPQIARFPENLTGNDLLALLGSLRNDQPVCDYHLVDSFALHEAMQKPLRTLSGGTRQKVNAALAFAFRPELLILDEPTTGLDQASSAALKDTILAGRSAGRTVVITSHVMSDLEELADDLILLVDGRVEFAGELNQLLSTTAQRNLERAVASLLVRGRAA